MHDVELLRLAAGICDGAGWRAAAYLQLKLPIAVLGGYAVFDWAAALVNMSFPLWWRSMRNHPPGVHLNPVTVFTPFGWSGQGTFRVATFGGTFAAFAAGAGMLLAAPWVTRAVVSVDRWLIRGLLGPGTLLQRVRDLVDAAHHGAKDALVELRELVKGIHPPALDNGLADALATLAADSAIPVTLNLAIPARPTPAIETIAYFCAAELLANAPKHSHASRVSIDMAGQGGRLLLRITDDGRGGADPAHGTGLSGLAQRAAVVDGRLHIASPPGGPTQITVELPLRA